MSTATASTGAAKKSNEKQQQEIIAHFQKLRDEQRIIASKAAELQIEQKSHEFVHFKAKCHPRLRSNFPFWILRLVIETLKEVEKDRKCFRMIGGVLVERTVNEVLPALETNKDQVWPFMNPLLEFLKFISI